MDIVQYDDHIRFSLTQLDMYSVTLPLRPVKDKTFDGNDMKQDKLRPPIILRNIFGNCKYVLVTRHDYNATNTCVLSFQVIRSSNIVEINTDCKWANDDVHFIDNNEQVIIDMNIKKNYTPVIVVPTYLSEAFPHVEYLHQSWCRCLLEVLLGMKYYLLVVGVLFLTIYASYNSHTNDDMVWLKHMTNMRKQ